MFERLWYRELKGAAAFWLASLVFIVVGGAFVAVGVLAESVFVFIGIPFLGLGLLILSLMVGSLYIKVKRPENYGTWLWWVNFVGGLLGALLFAVPSSLALPLLLLLDMGDEALWIGALFSLIGVAVIAVVVLIARKQYRERPRWLRKDEAA
jgi:hypothetical protein